MGTVEGFRPFNTIGQPLQGDFSGHITGDASCPACQELPEGVEKRWPREHEGCGGLVHAQYQDFLPQGEGSPEHPGIVQVCDACGARF